jgi:hypothetical protein
VAAKAARTILSPSPLSVESSHESIAHSCRIYRGAGCYTTKTYGRQSTLTNYEKASMTCREIDLDMAKTRGFIDHVNMESEFSGKDVLAFLGDFGIGNNNMEKSAALESANNRIESLSVLRRMKQCPSSSV